MNSNESLSDKLKNELEAISSQTIFNPAYKKKKLLLWSIRTILTVVLYIIFWKYSWVRWSLVVLIPLSAFNLFMIFAYPYIFKRKIEKVKQRIDALEKSTTEENKP